MEYVIGSTCPNSLEAYQSYNCLGVIVIKLGNNNSRYLTTILVTYSYILQYLDFLGLLMQRLCVYIYIYKGAAEPTDEFLKQISSMVVHVFGHTMGPDYVGV